MYGIAYKKLNTFLAAIVMCVLFLQTETHAEYIQFTFTGEVTEVEGTPWEPWSEAEVGDAFKIQYVFDSNAEDQISGSEMGRYSFLELLISIGGNELSTSEGYINIYHRDLFGDRYTLRYVFSDQLSGSGSMYGENMFQSDALPTDIDWTQYGDVNGFWGGVASLPAGVGSIDYLITDFEAAIVPAAPTLVLFVFGIFLRRRKQ